MSDLRSRYPDYLVQIFQYLSFILQNISTYVTNGYSLYPCICNPANALSLSLSLSLSLQMQMFFRPILQQEGSCKPIWYMNYHWSFYKYVIYKWTNLTTTSTSESTWQNAVKATWRLSRPSGLRWFREKKYQFHRYSVKYKIFRLKCKNYRKSVKFTEKSVQNTKKWSFKVVLIRFRTFVLEFLVFFIGQQLIQICKKVWRLVKSNLT